MQLPMAIIRAGARHISESSLTQNISSGGVLFTASQELDIGGPIEYVITLNREPDRIVNLHCIGKVVRFERTSPVPGAAITHFAVAATLERYEFLRS